jgi:hypothetical protein
MTPGIHRLFAFRHLAVGFGIVLLATTAHAQAPADPDAAAQAQASAQVTTAPVRPAYWASIGGFEGDTHGTGYGFFGPSYVRPISDNMAITGSVYGNYLYYEYDRGDGETRVRSPGASAKVGLRFGEHNTFGFNAGPSFKHQRRTDTFFDGRRVSNTKLRLGLSFGADMYANPTSHNNVQGLITHNTEDQYTWGRIGFKEQLTNRNWSGTFAHFLGAEFIGQGNEDIRSQQVGGFVEFIHVPSTISVMLRTGYKMSSFDVGPDKKGPYFAVGFYQRMK